MQGSLICDKYSGHISSTPIMSIPEEKEEGGKMSTGNTKTSTTITVMDSLSKVKILVKILNVISEQ